MEKILMITFFINILIIILLNIYIIKIEKNLIKIIIIIEIISLLLITICSIFLLNTNTIYISSLIYPIIILFIVEGLLAMIYVLKIKNI